MNSKLAFLLVKFFPLEKRKGNKNKESTSHKKRDAFMNRFYSARNTNEEKKKNKMIASNMTDDIRQLQNISQSSFLVSCFKSLCRRDRSKKKLIQKSLDKIDKELDLKKFIHRIRS